jgi:hypothetical protein
MVKEEPVRMMKRLIEDYGKVPSVISHSIISHKFSEGLQWYRLLLWARIKRKNLQIKGWIMLGINLCDQLKRPTPQLHGTQHHTTCKAEQRKNVAPSDAFQVGAVSGEQDAVGR